MFSWLLGSQDLKLEQFLLEFLRIAILCPIRSLAARRETILYTPRIMTNCKSLPEQVMVNKAMSETIALYELYGLEYTTNWMWPTRISKTAPHPHFLTPLRQ